MWPRCSRKLWTISIGFGPRGLGALERLDGGGGTSVGMVAHGRKALDEAIEVSDALIEVIEVSDVHEIVDAAVLLQHPDVELLGDPVELGGYDGVHRLPTVHRDHLLLQDLPFGEREEEVLGEGG